MSDMRKITVAFLFVAIASACGGEEAGDGANNGSAVAECQAGDPPRECICESGIWGTQTCENGRFAPCVCAAPQAGSSGGGAAGASGSSSDTAGTSGSGGMAGAEEPPECVEGEQSSCACSTGGIGVMVCANGRYGPCTGCPGDQAGTGGAGGTGGTGWDSGLPDYVTVDPIAVCPEGFVCQQVIVGTGPRLCVVPGPFGLNPSAPQCSTNADCEAMGFPGVPCLASPGYGKVCTQPCL
jgi:hypothetical protein